MTTKPAPWTGSLLLLIPILPIWTVVTIVAPPLGFVLAAAAILYVLHDRRQARRIRARAAAEHKRIWGF